MNYQSFTKRLLNNFAYPRVQARKLTHAHAHAHAETYAPSTPFAVGVHVHVIRLLFGFTTKFSILVALVGPTMVLTGCGIQSIPQQKNAVDAALSEVSNQYKRRLDLVPNLVNSVKGYAKHEESVLTEVTEARAKATQMTVDPSKVTAQQLQQFQQAQGQLSQALGRLLMVAERYPDLKADRSFADLMAQLEGTENRITVARQRYIEEVKNFNNLVTVPPYNWTNSLFYHYEKMVQWELAAEEKTKAEQAPKVEF